MMNNSITITEFYLNDYMDYMLTDKKYLKKYISFISTPSLRAIIMMNNNKSFSFYGREFEPKKIRIMIEKELAKRRSKLIDEIIEERKNK